MQTPVIRLSCELAHRLQQVILIFSKQLNQIVTVFEIFNIATVMWNLIVWQKFSVHLYVSGFQWMRCDTDKNFAKFCQILTSRFCDIIVSLHIFVSENQQNKGSLHFP